ncbi:YqcC family protein [Paraglaciecola aquimarina]|uniref:YqcC family protein n=1 Tax=Paraglaciecola aquimarina TaxID=1235557 RepID=A0ABU3T1F0_9ALTE|nr:YqcC family protein [Paraglaciecola aquimarina]MDU0356088.1 YqcC family protein [Paraglaciecola aquimarina]
MPRSHKEVETLLIKLESCLKNSQIWSDIVPPEEALASKVPFAYDTMALESWLQFIFIPQIRYLIRSNQMLPNDMALYPMAEMQFSKVQNS